MTPAPFAPLSPAQYQEVVRRALAEDIGSGDVTTAATVAPGVRARGVFVAKSPCVIAGLDVAAEAFRQLDADVSFRTILSDGTRAAAGTLVAEVRGSAAAMITAERTALNLLQRMSGIATLTRAFVEAAAGGVTILDTRKTTPMLRALEKYAVRAGGGTNHRDRLDTGILIKDNHIRLAGGVGEALSRMRRAGRALPIEIEAQSLDQVDDAIAGGADIVLLDNLDDADVREAVRRIAGRARIEVSGGITLARVPALAAMGVDYVSVGALTHSAPAVDLSFEIEQEGGQGAA